MTNALQATNANTALIAAKADEVASRHTFTNYQNRRAANTNTRHQVDLATFGAYLNSVGVFVADDGDALYSKPEAWRGVSWGLVQSFAAWLLGEGYAVGTVNLKLSTVRTYAGLAQLAGVLTGESVMMIKAVEGYSRREGVNVDTKRAVTRTSTKKAQAVELSSAQMDTLKTQHGDTAQGRRDALLMCLLLDLGLRAGEVAGLRVGNVSLSANTITVYREKVNITQTHKLVNGLGAALRRYMAQDAHADKSAPLLRASRKGGTLAEGGMSRIVVTQRVNVLGKLIGIENLSAHDCRHAWATANTGRGLEWLKEAGGWASLAMPAQYIAAKKIAND